MVWFGLVQFFNGFGRTLNWTIGLVQNGQVLVLKWSKPWTRPKYILTGHPPLCWWDPILPIHLTNHVQHFCNNLERFGLKDDKGRQGMTRFATILRCLIPFYNTLQCSLSLLQPFLTFSDAFRPFATFLNFALFNTLSLRRFVSLFLERFIRPFSHD